MFLIAVFFKPPIPPNILEAAASAAGFAIFGFVALLTLCAAAPTLCPSGLAATLDAAPPIAAPALCAIPGVAATKPLISNPAKLVLPDRIADET